MISRLVSFRASAGDVGLGGGVAGHADERDAPEGLIRGAVSAAVESRRWCLPDDASIGDGQARAARVSWVRSTDHS
jgi:hypothetical protein